MAKAKLLLVGADGNERQTLELCLRKARIIVTVADDAAAARDQIAVDPPDLIVAETALAEGDGFSFCAEIRAHPVYQSIPIVLLGHSASVDDRIHALEAGADEYVPPPRLVHDVVGRIRLLLQRQSQELFGLEQGRTRFSGDLSDMAMLDLVKRIGATGRAGVLTLKNAAGASGEIYFREGDIIDATVGHRRGELALFRLLLWDTATFDVDLHEIDHPDTIARPLDAVLRRALRSIDEWSRLREQMPPLDSVAEIDYPELATRLGEIPDHYNSLLRLCNGRRKLIEIVDHAVDFDDLETLDILCRLYFDGIIFAKQALDFTPAEALPPAAERQMAGHAAAAYGRGLARRYRQNSDEQEAALVVAVPRREEAAAPAGPVPPQGETNADRFAVALVAQADHPDRRNTISALEELEDWLNR